MARFIIRVETNTQAEPEEREIEHYFADSISGVAVHVGKGLADLIPSVAVERLSAAFGKQLNVFARTGLAVMTFVDSGYDMSIEIIDSNCNIVKT